MKTQAETDRIKLKAKVRYRDAVVRFQMKHLDFRLLAAEALDGNNIADAEEIQPESEPEQADSPPQAEAELQAQEEGDESTQVPPQANTAEQAPGAYAS